VEIRRRISIMPESPGLYLRLSVTENLECFADLYEAPHPHDRIGRALRAVNLTDRANDACGTLSKGLRQRVASLPTAVLAALVAFDVIHPALGAAATWAQLQRMRTCLCHCSTRPGRPSVVISSARFHRLR
jgi:ABC-type nitrate/sulfonate/bicarbonate transport system ATPase subunit